MAANPTNLPAVTAAGFAALNRGDPNAARALFDQAVSAGVADAAVWYGLARTHRVLGAAAEESAALDKALGLDAQFLPALLARGDWFARRGDRRAADSFYSVAIKVAAGMPSLPPEWRAEVRRVEASSSGFTREYEAHLLAALSAAGLGTPGTERFGHAIDLLLGKRQIFLQQPKYFFFPNSRRFNSSSGSCFHGRVPSSARSMTSARRRARYSKRVMDSSPICSEIRAGRRLIQGDSWTTPIGAHISSSRMARPSMRMRRAVREPSPRSKICPCAGSMAGPRRCFFPCCARALEFRRIMDS